MTRKLYIFTTPWILKENANHDVKM